MAFGWGRKKDSSGGDGVGTGTMVAGTGWERVQRRWERGGDGDKIVGMEWGWGQNILPCQSLLSKIVKMSSATNELFVNTQQFVWIVLNKTGVAYSYLLYDAERNLLAIAKFLVIPDLDDRCKARYKAIR